MEFSGAEYPKEKVGEAVKRNFLTVKHGNRILARVPAKLGEMSYLGFYFQLDKEKSSVSHLEKRAVWKAKSFDNKKWGRGTMWKA